MIRVLLVTTVALAGLSIGLPNIAPDVPLLAEEGSPARLLFGVSQEMNIPTAFSVALLVGAGVAHAVVGRLVGGRTGTAFTVVALVLVALAFDDFAAFHERLVVVADLMGIRDGYGWVFPGLVVAAAVVAVFVRLFTRLRGPVRRDLLVGILMFLGAAFGLEYLNGTLDRPGTDGAPLQVGTHVEEVVENVGVILVLRAALGMLLIANHRGSWALRLAESQETAGPVLADSVLTGGPVLAESRAIAGSVLTGARAIAEPVPAELTTMMGRPVPVERTTAIGAPVPAEVTERIGDPLPAELTTAIGAPVPAEQTMPIPAVR